MNPFTYGNPISDPARFVNRRYEVDQVFTRLQNTEFESSSIIGERRIGKTSLLNYLAHPNVQFAHGLDPNKYLFVYSDMQMVNENMTPTRFWQRLFEGMILSCRDPNIKQAIRLAIEKIHGLEPIDTYGLEDILNSIDEDNLRIVLLLDEFEHVTRNPNFQPSFFESLRALAIRLAKRNLALITSSRRELGELCHSQAISSSPFFNIFGTIILRPFTKDDAQHLISHSLNGTNIHFSQEEINAVFQLAGCHPHFLQVACHFLFQAHLSQLAPSEHILFMTRKFLEQTRPHLSKYWSDSTDQEKILLTALVISERQRKVGEYTFTMRRLQELYARSETILTELEHRGLIVKNNDTYFLFSSSFADWIQNEITDTMRDQQSYVEWIKSNKNVMERLSGRVKKDMAEILPKISSNYRGLIISWASDPKNFAVLAELLKILVLHR